MSEKRLMCEYCTEKAVRYSVDSKEVLCTADAKDEYDDWLENTDPLRDYHIVWSVDLNQWVSMWDQNG